MPWSGLDLCTGLTRGRVERAATALLVIRVLEGLAAWLLFNEFFLGTAPVAWWAVPAAFVIYLTLNLIVTLNYRAGRMSTSLLVLDVLTNVAPLTLPLAASGGLASPLLLLFPVKAIVYVMVFNPRVAWLSLVTSGVMLAAVVAFGRAEILPVVRLYEVPGVTVYGAVRLALLCQLVIAPLAIAWLRHIVTAAEQPSPAQRLRDRQERDSAAAANTVLGFTDALGGLLHVDEVVRAVDGLAARALGADACSMVLWSDTSGGYEIVAAHEQRLIDAHIPSPTTEEVKDFEWARRLGHCVVVPGFAEAEPDQPEGPALLLAPLDSGGRFEGVLRFLRTDARRGFTQRDLTLADGLARQTALALRRAIQFERAWALARAVESTGEAVVITDLHRRVLYANAAFLRAFGYEEQEMLGRDALELAGPNADWMNEARLEVGRRGWRAEVVARRKDGAALPLVVHTSPLRGEDGEVEGVVAVAQDVSAEKSFQEQLQRADRLAALGEMAAGIAHEINNALTAIFGQLDSVDRLPEPELRTAFKRVDRQARRIADIVQGVVGFARPRPLRTEPVDLAAVTEETLDLIRHELHAVSLETDYDRDLPPVLADRQQVQQVLLNLLTNARQAMAGHQPMRLRVEVVGADDRLAVRVTDSGPGVPPEVLPRIFDPFFSTKAEGTGLGLSVSYAIARAHGGELTADNEPGRGARFSLLLPIAVVRTPATPQTALLVDDEPEVAQSLADMLAKEGFTVESVTSGGEALSKLETGEWDVIFLDVRLPDLPGPQIFAELARNRPTLAARVVFVTGGVWRSDSRLRDELPPQPILAKPCTQEQLRDVLRILRSRQRKAA